MLKKIIYFSDGCGRQYKNYKNFMNLMQRKFFATSHGKNACDGVGGTVKRPAAHVSLQRAKEKQFLTPNSCMNLLQKRSLGLLHFICPVTISKEIILFSRIGSLWAKLYQVPAYTIVLFQYQIQRCDFQESQVKVSQMLFTEIMLYMTTSTILKKLKLGVT